MGDANGTVQNTVYKINNSAWGKNAIGSEWEGEHYGT